MAGCARPTSEKGRATYPLHALCQAPGSGGLRATPNERKLRVAVQGRPGKLASWGLGALALVLALGPGIALARPAARPAPPPPPSGPPSRLEVEGEADAFYYPPRTRARPRPAIVYLHGRSGYPEQDCEKWAKVARGYGWLLCPSGQEERGGGARGWANNWPAGRLAVDRAFAALRKKAGRGLSARGHTLIGFSEGAYVAMNVGVREPETFDRWLILAANDVYWGGEGEAELRKNRRRIKRVYLLTGSQDEVVDATRRVFDSLDRTGVHVMLRTPDDLGHDVPEARMRELYDRPLAWLAMAR